MDIYWNILPVVAFKHYVQARLLTKSFKTLCCQITAPDVITELRRTTIHSISKIQNGLEHWGSESTDLCLVKKVTTLWVLYSLSLPRFVYFAFWKTDRPALHGTEQNYSSQKQLRCRTCHINVILEVVVKLPELRVFPFPFNIITKLM